MKYFVKVILVSCEASIHTKEFTDKEKALKYKESMERKYSDASRYIVRVLDEKGEIIS